MKLYLSQKDIFSMVSEVIRHIDRRAILSEIKAEDAYSRFYADKLPKEVYEKVMTGTPNMTPLHKLALDHLVKLYADGNENVGDRLINTVSNFWANASEEARQYAIKMCKDGAEELKSDANLFKTAIEKIGEMKSHTENSYSSRGLEVLYESENIRVTCTKSYTSSCKNFGGSHWCTASDQFGDYDGYLMFKRYTSDGILVQFYSKHNEDFSFQVQYQFANNGQTKFECACNWEDEGITLQQIKDYLFSLGEPYGEIYANFIKPNAKRLFAETKEILKDEDVYYQRRRVERLKNIKASIVENLNGKDAEEFAKKYYSVIGTYKNNYMYSEDYAFRAYREGNSTVLKKNTKFTLIAVVYNGRNTDEKNVIERYCDLGLEEATMEYGVITNVMEFLFDAQGNIAGKYLGQVSCYDGCFAIITDNYDDDLEMSKVLYVIDMRTGKVVLRNCSPISIYDTDDYIHEIDAFSENGYSAVDFILGDKQKKEAYGLFPDTGQIIKVPYLEDFFYGTN